MYTTNTMTPLEAFENKHGNTGTIRAAANVAKDAVIIPILRWIICAALCFGATATAMGCIVAASATENAIFAAPIPVCIASCICITAITLKKNKKKQAAR